ncbi:hypothetical protein [Streptomyces roseoverticillatus]|uniref:Integrase n=1 Tax=Streptomyces roseoverticillatus TaxID=66429 RepID=A0ABV3J313_9ACTN
MLRNGGRELLVALTLYSRCVESRWRYDGGPAATHSFAEMRDFLRSEARNLMTDADTTQRLSQGHKSGRDTARELDARGSARLRALNIFGTAVEIDSVDAEPVQDEILGEIKCCWARFGWGEDPEALREAKLALVRQCGAAARRVAALPQGEPAYGTLFEIGGKEPDYRVRAAIAQEIGAGGEKAYGALDVYPHLHHARNVVSGSRPAEPPKETETDCLSDLSPMAHQGDRDQRAVQRVLKRSKQRLERLYAEEEAAEEKRNWYCTTMCAWVLPMLVDSAMMARHLGSPRDDLEEWVSEATDAPSSHDGEAFPGTQFALGVTLAQGFKYAANRRLNAQSDREARQFLVKQAQDMLRRSTFWYTRLTLLHALTLWALPDDVREPQPIRGHGADPRGQVREWLALPKGQKEHPLVEAAGRLAVRALQTRRPERFLWIDEAGVASEVGTEVGPPGEQRAHNLWIPPSTGWSTLDPTAQQLLADVLLLAVLCERGYRPKDLFHLLDRTCGGHSQLPFCLSHDRARLDPVRAVERTGQPGTRCTDKCGMKMCPYPAKAESLRLEFSEVFCLHQGDLLRTWRPRDWLFLRFRREAPWQRKVPVAGMRRFWDRMGDRARDTDPEGADSCRGRDGAGGSRT